MTNAFLNAQTYSNIMLLLLKNQLVMGRLVDGRFKDEVTDQNGLTTSIKRPPRFVAGTGAALSQQFLVTGSANVAVNQYRNVHISVGDLEAVQSFNDLMRNETMKSAASTLAHAIDSYLIGRTLEFHSAVGTIGTNIASPAAFNQVHTKLMEQGVPNAELSSVVLFKDAELIRGSLIGGNIQGVVQTALERTRVPILSEIDVYATQQIPTLTTGTRTNGTISGAAQNVNFRTVKDTRQQTLNLAGVGANATITAGETFVIAGVLEWDHRSQPGKANTNLQRFTVLADAVASAGGAATVTISPPIVVQGTTDGITTITNTAYATVNVAPANAAVVTWDGAASTAFSVRTAFHKRSIAMVTAKLETPFNGEVAFSTDPTTGISIRYWRGSDIATGQHIHRWDTIFGATNVDRHLGSRVYG